MINPGKYTHKIDIKYNAPVLDEQNNQTYDGYNKPITEEATFLSTWAAMHTTGGRIFYAAQKRNAEASAVFEMRYKPGVTTDMWVTENGHRYEIIWPNDEDGRKERLLLECKEVV